MQINPMDILKNAQKIMEQTGSIQEKLGVITVTGSAGGGMVEVDLNGQMETLAVRITPEMVSVDNRDLLQDLIAAAFTNAMEKVKEAVNREMGALVGAAGMSGMSSLWTGK